MSFEDAHRHCVATSEQCGVLAAAAAAFASLHLEDTPRESARAIDAHSVAQDDSPISVHSQRIAGLAS